MVNVGIFNAHLEYVIAIWYILWSFGSFVVIWLIFTHFGILCQDKSGNPCKSNVFGVAASSKVRFSAEKMEFASTFGANIFHLQPALT
jgi:hypothetical protein